MFPSASSKKKLHPQGHVTIKCVGFEMYLFIGQVN